MGSRPWRGWVLARVGRGAQGALVSAPRPPPPPGRSLLARRLGAPADPRTNTIKDQIRAVIGPGPDDDFPVLLPEPTAHTPGPLPAFEHLTHMCLAALCDGWEAEECLSLWSRVQTGTFSKTGHTFRPGPYRVQSADFDWPRVEVRTISRALGESPVNIYVSHGQIVAITAGARLRSKASSRPGAPLPSLSSLPDFIALPRDESGRPIIPKSRVAALVEAQEGWHTELAGANSTPCLAPSSGASWSCPR
jgi:hypothetical protein